MNRRYVFKNDTTKHNRVWLFIGVTLFGIFVLQSAVIALSLPILQPLASMFFRLSTEWGIPVLSGFSINFYESNMAKVVATGATMIWNYTLYKKVIFKK
jgi:putative flippase GtrA